MATLTRAHPSVRVEVLDRLEVSPGRVLFDVQLPSNPTIHWSDELRLLARVHSVELIDATARIEVYRILFEGRTFLPLAKRMRILRRFPFPIENGVATWTIVGPEPRVQKLLRTLRRSRIPFRIDSVRRGLRADIAAPLTPRQREVLSRAVAEGYFDVPRRISLTELATRLDVASSTLSVTLAVIEKKIVEPLASAPPSPPASRAPR
jgi:predicted DNA binding protein